MTLLRNLLHRRAARRCTAARTFVIITVPPLVSDEVLTEYVTDAIRQATRVLNGAAR